MIVLGIETSCDETAAAVVDDERRIRSDVVLSQLDDHRPYGGVVPEIAARAHVLHIDGLVRRALDTAGVTFSDLHGVAATAGPGLIGGVMVGLVTGKSIAAAAGLPLVAVNHLEGHALTARLTEGLDFPYLLLLVSGGHCQLVEVRGVGDYRRLGTTIDDAVGEAFDKTAKLLGLGYPGGPAVERAAATGDPRRFDLPRPMKGRPGCDFSFSGLKTAVRHAAAALAPAGPTPGDAADLAAAFQAAVGDVLVDRTSNALADFATRHDGPRTLVIAGGVAANGFLRTRLAALCAAHRYRLVAPPSRLCTDNAAMIAWAGIERLRLGLSDPLDAPARARWPLDPDAAPRGQKGAGSAGA
jgi:N6-L-threonylcarbamoyladenine synthase